MSNKFNKFAYKLHNGTYLKYLITNQNFLMVNSIQQRTALLAFHSYFKMGSVNSFLESSTIHGVSYIASPNRAVKLFWILVVTSCFSLAFYLISESFKSWASNPITTTIEQVPIKEIKFPKVTVCPPKNTYSNLNYDLMMADQNKLDDTTRDHLRLDYSKPT